MLFVVDIDNAIDHENSRAMRRSRRISWISAISSVSPLIPSVPSVLRPRRTRRRTVPCLRFHSITGSAGNPAQRAPAGHVGHHRRPCAPTTAPSPIVACDRPRRRWPAKTALSPTVTLPDMPTCETIRQCRPIETLCPICTRLSILVPSPMTVSRVAPRSML